MPTNVAQGRGRTPRAVPDDPPPAVAPLSTTERLWRCDFCGAPPAETEQSFSSRSAVICAECVETAYSALLEGRQKKGTGHAA